MNDGKYTGECVDCFFQDAKSGALQIVMKINVGGQTYTHYQTLIDKVGNDNPYGVKLLDEVLGIDWTAPDKLATIEAVEAWKGIVRVVIATEQDQNGQARQRIKYVNPANQDGPTSAGRLTKAQLAARFSKPKPEPDKASEDGDNLPF
jgi:hypothetical protein